MSDQLTRTVLTEIPAARPPASGSLDSTSWDLPGALASADVVHVFQPYTRSSEASALTAKALGKPLFITDCGVRSSQLGVSMGLLDLADGVICSSQFGRSILPVSDGAQVLSGGVDADFFTPGKPTERRTHLLCAGRLVPSNGVDRVIAALPDRIPLVVCGRPCHEEYSLLLDELARGKDIEFVTDASDEELRKLYRSAWATVVSPVYQDCFDDVHPQAGLMGLTALESMSCATPVVASDVGALPELVDHGSTGLIASTSESLEDSIHSIFTDRSKSIRMGLRARDSVVDRYSMGQLSRRIGQIYGEAVKRTQSSPI
jgi:glycosyltransferase involved in cell wall biosynthesis